MSVTRNPGLSGRRWRTAAGVMALVVSAWLTVAPPQAGADCTGAGDFGAGSGCAPPGGGSSSAKAWPPTAVDWPPTVDSDSDSGASDNHGSAATPIVLPDGQKPATTTSRSPDVSSASKTTSTSSTPIVPVGPPVP